MRRLLAMLALLTACVAAAAADGDWLTMECVNRTGGPLPAPTEAPKPACLPAPAGAGTNIIVESNPYGMAAGWWCKGTSKTPPRFYLYAMRWSALSPALMFDAALVAMSTSKAAAIQAHQRKWQTSDIRDLCDVWGPMAPRLLAVRP